MKWFNVGYIITTAISGFILFNLGLSVGRRTGLKSESKIVYVPQVIINSAEVSKEEPPVKPHVVNSVFTEPKLDPRLENLGAIQGDGQSSKPFVQYKTNIPVVASANIKPVSVPEPIILEEIPDNPYKTK